MNTPQKQNVSETPMDGPDLAASCLQLTVTDIIRLLGRAGDAEKRTRSTLSRYLDEHETRALLGASGPVRPTFPHASVPVIQALLDAAERGDMTPKMATVWLVKHFPSGADKAVPVVSGNREIESPRTDASAEFLLAVQTLVERVPVREDRLLTSAEAANQLACRPRSVSRYVRPVRRGAYRWTDVMRHIEGLKPFGEAPGHRRGRNAG